MFILANVVNFFMYSVLSKFFDGILIFFSGGEKSVARDETMRSCHVGLKKRKRGEDTR